MLVDVLLIMAALTGDTVNYFLGRSLGPRVFSREDSRYFRRDYLLRTRDMRAITARLVEAYRDEVERKRR